MSDDRLVGMSPSTDPPSPVASRRRFLLAGVGLVMTGCASTARQAVVLPGPTWDEAGVGGRGPATGGGPMVPPTGPGGVIPRSTWASGQPVPTLMKPMRPVQYITVHHDAMYFSGERQAAAAARLESIRRGHRGRQWGDIGYHFAVDRSGNVWEGRPLAFQGAHVKDYNEGNVGIVLLGNFDQQEPTSAQLGALQGHLALLMRRYRVPVSRVRTHQEWAATRCPGTNLQRQMIALRGGGRLA